MLKNKLSKKVQESLGGVFKVISCVMSHSNTFAGLHQKKQTPVCIFNVWGYTEIRKYGNTEIRKFIYSGLKYKRHIEFEG
jgi:hypothetical protein